MAKMNSIRLCISLAANQEWPTIRLDVKNTFLHEDVEEKVHMKPPPGF